MCEALNLSESQPAECRFHPELESHAGPGTGAVGLTWTVLRWAAGFYLPLFVILGLLFGSVAARAQSPLPSPTAGIPGSAAVPPGGSTTFFNGTQSLSVAYQLLSGVTAPSGGPAALVSLATVTYDGVFLTIETQGQRFANVTMHPPDDQSCAYLNGRVNAVRCAIASPPGREPVSFTAAGAPPSYPCPDAQLSAGWNLVSGGLARSVNTNVGPLYTYQPSDSGYNSASNLRDLPESIGYWVYFDEPASVFDFDVFYFDGCGRPPLSQVPPPSPVNFGLTLGQWVMIGNSFPDGTVTGADRVLTFDPMNGYLEVQTLGLGQGAWVYSANGGTITVSPTGP